MTVQTSTTRTTPTSVRFPHDFVWGMATASYQIEGAAASVGIDAPLLGLARPGRRPCDNEVSRVFGRFHASTHTPSRVPALAELTARLVRRYGLHALDPAARAWLRSAIEAAHPSSPWLAWL